MLTAQTLCFEGPRLWSHHFKVNEEEATFWEIGSNQRRKKMSPRYSSNIWLHGLFLFDRPSRLPANACQSDTSLTAGGIFTLAYHPQGSGWRWDRCLKPSSVVWMFAGSGSSSSKMFSVIPSNQMSVLTLCPGWSPVLSWALRPVVDKSPTHISATLDRQDPNKLRQQQHMTL